MQGKKNIKLKKVMVLFSLSTLAVCRLHCEKAFSVSIELINEL